MSHPVNVKLSAQGSSSLRDPSTLFYQKDYVRRSILLSYWIIIVFALPLWWHTTSIQRLSLPSSRVYSQAERHLQFPIEIDLEIPVSVENDPPFTTQLKQLLDERILRAPDRWKGIDVHVNNTRRTGMFVVKDEETFSYEPYADSPGTYTIVAGPKMSLHDRHLTFPLAAHTLSDLADTLSALIVPYSTIPDQEHRVIQYSPRYRLAFTLLNEDAAAGQFVSGWDVSDAISRHLTPILDRLSTLHSFAIESQVQFHAPLAFNPRQVDENTHGLTLEDLTVFVNSAEWSLSSSVSNDPVLHFILFVPSASRRPLQILDVKGRPSPSNAFLLPQWGGIVIFDPPETSSNIHLTSSYLDPIFSAFSRQLLSLLGVPHLPPGVSMSDSEVFPLTEWQLDSLLRRRALENTRGSRDTLRSIVKLVNKIENMPVGQRVKGDIQDALIALDKADALSSTSLIQALQYSARALVFASRAFFNPGMLALLYFPAEHKYAVYTPLFASAVIPLVAAAVRELLAWNKQRRYPAQGAQQVEVEDDGQQRRLKIN